jgi:large repetitive protein
MRNRALIVVGSVVCGLFVAIGVNPSADAAVAPLVSETFTGSSVAASSWVLPSASGAGEVDQACLTASSNTAQAPIPGCGTSAGTVAGLQLTQPLLNQEGGLAYTSSVPSSLGLDVTFDSYQFGGTGADGIVFYLAASDPTNAHASPVTLGPSGGYLGYSADAAASVAGLTHGYLGIGLDPFGNYTNPGFAGTGCSDPGAGAVRNSITVRGPGNATSGYCLLSTQPNVTLNGAQPQDVPVEVAVNPTGSTLTAAGGFAVAAHSVVVKATPIGADAVTETDPLPNASSYVPDASWVDGSGVPQQLSFGWSASTGSSTDYHVIANARVQTLNGTPPALTVGLSDNSGGTARSGQTVTYQATAAVTAAAETRTISLTDTFPSGLTPQPGGLGGPGWACNINGQTINCTHAAASIGPLPAVAMPVLVAVASPTSLSDTVTVGSPDATQGNATDVRSYSSAPTATVLSFVTQPVNSQLNAAMTNADGSTTHLQVAADVTPGAAIDSSYAGPITLAFATNPVGAKFVVGNTTSTTLTAAAVNGVANFSPIIVNAIGFGYTLQATATGLTTATSTAFDVSAAATSCAANKTCTVIVTSPGSTESAVVTAAAGPGTAVISATYGGNVAPIYPCTSTTGILTFSGNRAKTITITMPYKLIPTLLFCYGQPTPFTTLLLQKTTHFNPINQDYEGLLPLCLLVPNGPCVSSLSLTKTTETVVIKTGTNDPHIAG